MDNGCTKFALSPPDIRAIDEAAILHDAGLRETRETGLDASVNTRLPRRRFLKRWTSRSGPPRRRPEVGLDESVTSRKPFVKRAEVGLDESVTSRKPFRRNRSSATSLSTSGAGPSSQTREVGLDESVTSRTSFKRRSASRRVALKDASPESVDKPASSSRISIPMLAAIEPRTDRARMA